jgi:hypothetical protein
MKVIIDRFEGEYAVVELPDRSMATISKVLLPQAMEGDVVDILIDKSATAGRKKRLEDLARDLWED